MCPLLAQLIIGFFSLFFAAAIYSANEKTRAIKQSIILDVYESHLLGIYEKTYPKDRKWTIE